MLKIDQALLTAFVDGGFGLPIAHENLDFEPTPGEAYAELLVLQNDATPATLKHTNETDGVFRVILRYPVNKSSIPAKTKVDEIFAVFKIGQRLTYGGVSLTLTANQRAPGINEDGWYKLVLTMPYRAFLAR